MRKYYLFIIKKEFYELYLKNIETLYFILENIYYLNKNDFSFGFSIYKQLCEPFNKNVLINYFNNKNKRYIKKFNNKFFINDVYAGEKSCIQINKSCIVIKTKQNLPYALKIFKWYNNYIFVCDFENKDYFWLNNNKLRSKIKLYEYSYIY